VTKLERILRILEKEENLTTEQIAEKLGASRVRVRAGLLRLLEEGKVEGVQEGEKWMWRIKKEREEEKMLDKLSKKIRS